MATDTPNTFINEKVRLSIIDEFVDIPDGPGTKRLPWIDALNAIAGSSLEISLGQKWFVLPVFERTNGYPIDYFQSLSNATSHAYDHTADIDI